MRIPFLVAALMSAATVVPFAAASAQQAAPGSAPAATPATRPPPPTYGTPLDITQAKKAAAAAVAKAKETGWPSSVAVVDPGGNILYVERMDHAFAASADVALNKAKSAATFARPTMVLEKALESGHTVVLGLGASVVGGGIPVVMQGKIVGAIGVSGAPASDPDIEAAQAGVAALQK